MVRIVALSAVLVLHSLCVHAQLPGQKPRSDNEPAQIDKPADRPSETSRPSGKPQPETKPGKIHTPYGTAPEGNITTPYRDGGRIFPLTDTEKGVFYKAFAKDATFAQKQMANDVCAKKCQPCHNGVECNFDCVKKSDCLK
jgi:hypothetical protein